MNDLHTTPSFKALDEGRLQPVDKGDVVVTQEARKAAADLLDEVSSLLGDTGIGQVAVLIRDGKYDEHDATLAFARFERDILARSRSEVGCTIPGNHPLAKGLRTSQKALDEIKRQEQANIAGYLAMRDMPIGSVAADTRHQSETGAALTRDGREALVVAMRKVRDAARTPGIDAHVLLAKIGNTAEIALAALAKPVEQSAPTQRMAETLGAPFVRTAHPVEAGDDGNG